MENYEAAMAVALRVFLRLTPHALRLTAVAMLCMALTACGFHLRGQAALPYESIFVQADTPGSVFASQLRRAVRSGSGTRVTDNPADAEVTLHVLSELRERSILSLSGGGRVRELQLRYRVAYRVTDKNQKELVSTSEIVLKRDLSYNDTDVIAKEQEEALLFRDMQNDAVQQLVRRLQALKA